MRRPWNIIDAPVYSLATYAGGNVNMNICTYVTAISLKPKMYAIAIYHPTKTLQNLTTEDTAILQLLSTSQMNLVKPLGKKTGLQYNKQQFLERKSQLTAWQHCRVLKNASAYILLKKISRQTTGDHELFCFEVEKYKTLSEDNMLMFQDLVTKGIIL